MKRGSGCTRRALIALGALIGGLLLAASPALAAPYKFSGTLAAPPGGFAHPVGIAEGTAGEVFVMNSKT
ncbi:MAG: hypothetical protein ACHQQS_17080, partial [Thermoanaerobaculales bacterium]